MIDYCAFVGVINRPDLLQNVVACASDLWDDFTIIDNSVDRWVSGLGFSQVRVFQPPVPLNFTQTMNFEMEETIRRGVPFCVHMHPDAFIPPGACLKLLDYAREVQRTDPKWGVIYTNYDVLAVYNPRAFQAIGGYDPVFPAYFSDNDWYRRLDLAGWTRINSGIEVQHGPEGQGSQTINSDPYLRMLNGITFPLYRQYYAAKWGGEPGYEQFTSGFNLG